MKKILTILFVIFNLYSSFSQIEYKITNVKVNNVAIPYGAAIEFNGASSVIVNFKVEFIKPDYLTIGAVTHVIGTRNSLGNFKQLISPENFALDINNTGFTGIWEKTLYATDYTFDSGNYLVSILQQTDPLQNGNWESNRIPINRGPNFQLNYNSLSIPCGYLGSRTFTLTNLSNSSGSISYNWNIGTGWSGIVNSNMSSITLTPIDGYILPSNISVTPIYNGVAQPTKTCTITRTPYTNTYLISGAGSLCSSSNYSITGLQSQETVQWSLSNTSIASLSNITANSVTVTKVGNGTVDLIATITNLCNQTTTIPPKSINLGAPSFSTTNMSGDSNPLTGETIVYHTQEPSGYTSLQWYFDYAGTTGTAVNGWEILNGQGTTTITTKVGNPGLTYVVCKAFNSCSNSIQYMPVSVRSIADPCYNFKINVKNPIKESDNLVGKIIPPPIDPCDDLNAKLIDKKERKKIQVFDLFGRNIFSGEFVEDNFDLHLDKLTKGTYLLNITLQDGKTQHETIIVQ